MQPTVLAPEHQVDESAAAPVRNLTAPAAVVAGVASLGTALLTDAALIAGALAILGILLGISVFMSGRGQRQRLLAAGLATTLSLGSVGSLVLFHQDNASTAGQMAIQSEVADSPIELTFGTVATDPATETTSVTVTVKNVTEDPVSTWASISATSPKGKKTYAAQGVGVKDLEPGASSTQQIYFDSVLPAKAVFVVKDVL